MHGLDINIPVSFSNQKDIKITKYKATSTRVSDCGFKCSRERINRDVNRLWDEDERECEI